MAIPNIIQNKSGETIYLGFPKLNKKTASQQYQEQCICDFIVSKMGRVPSEFILGTYFQDVNGNEQFIANEKHYSMIDDESREKVFDSFRENMNEITKSINEKIEVKDLENLKLMKDKMLDFNMDTALIDNSIELCQTQQTQRQSSITNILNASPTQSFENAKIEHKPRVRDLDLTLETR